MFFELLLFLLQLFQSLCRRYSTSLLCLSGVLFRLLPYGLRFCLGLLFYLLSFFLSTTQNLFRVTFITLCVKSIIEPHEYGIPVYCGADSMVADGGFATIGVDYVQLGRQVARIVVRLSQGEQPEDIPYEVLSEYAKFVNLQAAGRIGMDIDEETLAAYRVLVEADGTSHFGEQ